MKTIFFILLLIGGIAAQAQEQIKWPDHKKSAIILTYDDALPSQLKVAVPQLKTAGLTATFFLTSDIDSLSIPQWRNLSKAGFELGKSYGFSPMRWHRRQPGSVRPLYRLSDHP